MAMAFTIEWQAHRVEVRYSGECREDDLLNAVIRIQADERFDRTAQALHDFSACAWVTYSLSNLEEIAARNMAATATNANLRIAVVAQRQDVRDMIQAFDDIGLNPYPIAVFADRAAAEAWLGAA